MAYDPCDHNKIMSMSLKNFKNNSYTYNNTKQSFKVCIELFYILNFEKN